MLEFKRAQQDVSSVLESPDKPVPNDLMRKLSSTASISESRVTEKSKKMFNNHFNVSIFKSELMTVMEKSLEINSINCSVIEDVHEEADADVDIGLKEDAIGNHKNDNMDKVDRVDNLGKVDKVDKVDNLGKIEMDDYMEKIDGIKI